MANATWVDVIGSMGVIGNQLQGLANDMKAKRLTISSARIQSDYLDMTNKYIQEMRFTGKGLEENMNTFQERQQQFIDNAIGDDVDLRATVEPRLLAYRQEQIGRVYQDGFNLELQSLKSQLNATGYQMASALVADPNYMSKDPNELVKKLDQICIDADTAGDGKLNILTEPERKAMVQQWLISGEYDRFQTAITNAKTYKDKIAAGYQALSTSRFMQQNPEVMKAGATALENLNKQWIEDDQNRIDKMESGYLAQAHSLKNAGLSNVGSLPIYVKNNVDQESLNPASVKHFNDVYRSLETFTDKEKSEGDVPKELSAQTSWEMLKDLMEGRLTREQFQRTVIENVNNKKMTFTDGTTWSQKVETLKTAMDLPAFQRLAKQGEGIPGAEAFLLRSIDQQLDTGVSTKQVFTPQFYSNMEDNLKRMRDGNITSSLNGVPAINNNDLAAQKQQRAEYVRWATDPKTVTAVNAQIQIFGSDEQKKFQTFQQGTQNELISLLQKRNSAGFTQGPKITSTGADPNDNMPIYTVGNGNKAQYVKPVYDAKGVRSWTAWDGKKYIPVGGDSDLAKKYSW